MKGIFMMLKSFGISVTAEEVQALVDTVKVSLPQLMSFAREKFTEISRDIHEIKTRQIDIDLRLRAIEKRLDSGLLAVEILLHREECSRVEVESVNGGFVDNGR